MIPQIMPAMTKMTAAWKLSADALVVSDPQAVAWTFNIRGADVSHTPLPLAFAIIAVDSARLYVDESKLTDAAREAHPRSKLCWTVSVLVSVGFGIQCIFVRPGAPLWYVIF